MLQSHVIEIGGTFVGAAIDVQTGFRFRSAHAKVQKLDDRTWSSLAELKISVGQLFGTGRLSAGIGPASSNPLRHAVTPRLPVSETGAASWME